MSIPLPTGCSSSRFWHTVVRGPLRHECYILLTWWPYSNIRANYPSVSWQFHSSGLLPEKKNISYRLKWVCELLEPQASKAHGPQDANQWRRGNQFYSRPAAYQRCDCCWLAVLSNLRKREGLKPNSDANMLLARQWCGYKRYSTRRELRKLRRTDTDSRYQHR